MAVAFLSGAAGNNISDTISSSVGAGDMTLPMNSIALWPNKAFKVIVDRGLTTQEIIAVSGTSGSSLTVTGRGQESTTGVGHNAGATVESVPFSGDWNNVIDTLKNGFLATTGAVDTTKLVDLTTAQTLTTKRITKRVTSVTDAATVTPNADTTDVLDITAIAQAFTIANPSGTPTNAQFLVIRIKDNGTAREITWGNGYVAGGTALPSTTILSKILVLGFLYNTANSLNKWCLIASAQET